MSSLRAITAGLALVAVAAALQARQTTTSQQAAGAAQVTAISMTGEVSWIDDNLLVCRMEPNGDYRLFDVMPGRQFHIDGQPKLINELKLGTVLTAMVVTTTRPRTVRTTTVTDGTVVWASGDYVVVRLPSGENRDYKVPPTYKFIVNGKPASVGELKAGMNVSATKIVEEPRNEISTQTVVTGRSPK
jgi:hypothetical protein